MAKPSQVPARPRLLVLELWGLGDVALALPFLRAAAGHAEVTLVAKDHAEPLVRRFAPAVRVLRFDAPWTAFSNKYRLHRWPWSAFFALRRRLRGRRFDLGVAVRRDPRDHLLLRLAGARESVGFPWAGSAWLLDRSLPSPSRPHRSEHWRALATAFGWSWPEPTPAPRPGRRVVLHTGAAQSTRRWPVERYVELETRLRRAGWEVLRLDGAEGTLDELLDTLATADRFIGNDSGPGHLATLLGVPTFTIFGPQRPELFAPQHPQSAWSEGAPCPFKPCFDACRFAEPHCLLSLDTESVWQQIHAWLNKVDGDLRAPS